MIGGHRTTCFFFLLLFSTRKKIASSDSREWKPRVAAPVKVAGARGWARSGAGADGSPGPRPRWPGSAGGARPDTLPRPARSVRGSRPATAHRCRRRVVFTRSVAGLWETRSPSLWRAPIYASKLCLALGASAVWETRCWRLPALYRGVLDRACRVFSQASALIPPGVTWCHLPAGRTDSLSRTAETSQVPIQIKRRLH